MAEIILDKSYLDAASPAQIKSLCADHKVLMPDVLFYELTTTDEASKSRCFNKFPAKANPVELIPNVGTLLRYELSKHRAGTPLYDRREKVVFDFHNLLRTGTFQFTPEQVKARQNQEELVEHDTPNFFDLAMMVHVFFPYLNGMPYSQFPKAVQEAKLQMSSNTDKVCEIYARLLEHDAPPNAVKASALDSTWTYYRCIQVHVIYSLDLLLRYQGQIPPNTSGKFWRTIEHEMLDAEYVILASLAGAPACNEKRVIERFLLVRPDGLLFTY